MTLPYLRGFNRNRRTREELAGPRTMVALQRSLHAHRRVALVQEQGLLALAALVGCTSRAHRVELAETTTRDDTPGCLDLFEGALASHPHNVVVAEACCWGTAFFCDVGASCVHELLDCVGQVAKPGCTWRSMETKQQQSCLLKGFARDSLRHVRVLGGCRAGAGCVRPQRSVHRVLPAGRLSATWLLL